MTTKQFTDIYLTFGGLLYRVAFYLLESQADAEDAVQDLYIRLWNSRDSLENVRNPKSYCVTLMKNLCIDRIRKASYRQLDENFPDTVAADSETIGKETARRIAKAISELPEGQKKVLQMRVSDELSNEEIAAKTGMSNLTVRVLLSQARKKLKKSL